MTEIARLLKKLNDYCLYPVAFDMGPPPIINGRLVESDDVASRIMISIRKPSGWAILDGDRCLNNEGSWEYEPLPSARTDEFILRTRFPTLEMALSHYLNWKEEVEQWARRQRRQNGADVVLNIPEGIFG